MENKRYMSHHLPQLFSKFFGQLYTGHLSKPEVFNSGFSSPSTIHKLSRPMMNSTVIDPVIHQSAGHPGHADKNSPRRFQQTALYRMFYSIFSTAATANKLLRSRNESGLRRLAG